MADIESAVGLRAWSLGSFHTAGFVLAVVLGVHLSGSLAGRLARLNTPMGIAAFLGLWAVTWRITKAALLKMDPPIEDAGSGDIVASMIVAGGWNGVAIFAAIVLTNAAFAFARSSGAGTGAGLALLPILFLTAVLGSVLAFTIGGIVGFVCGAADAALVRAGAALDRWARAGR
jgi:hypothetical protein